MIEAATPSPWRLLGVPLHPFAFGHYIKLRSLDNAFVADEPREATLGDLLLLVCVCAHRTHPDPARDEFWLWLHRPPDATAWRRLLCRVIRWLGREPMTPAESDIAAMGRACGAIDLADKVGVANDYIAAHTSVPLYTVERESDKRSGTSWHEMILSVATSRCGMTREESLNLPMCDVMRAALLWLEAEGAIRFLQPHEADAARLQASNN